MRILYVAMKYDYGRPQQGLSFEHYNFYHSLLHMGHDIVYFDFMTLLQQHGRNWMNERLIEVARAEKPDVIFTVLFADELDQRVIRTLTEDVGIPTVNWFCDDHWRFDNYSRMWAPCFKWVVTTAQSALSKYAAMGYRNVIKSQWACNPFLYRRMDIPLTYDVTFIGQPYNDRRNIIQRLRQSGINASAWGTGWESGKKT
jgi:spore maturation protein CgeB